MPLWKESHRPPCSYSETLAWAGPEGRKVKVLGNTEAEGMKHPYTAPYCLDVCKKSAHLISEKGIVA